MFTQRSINEKLLTAVVSGSRVERVSHLLARGADPNARDDFGTPVLNVAARAPWSEAMLHVPLLLDHGASIEAADAHGRTALQTCARAGALETLALLLERGADVHARDPEGQTALMFACARLYPEMALVLLQHGARAADVDIRGYEARNYAEEALFPSPPANDYPGAEVERGARHYLVQLVLNEAEASLNQPHDIR